ncbi:hypothetical protein MKW98_019017 [Papaver atlanticum]|uniref:PGG domain-containing protein n=1 Tax=Papaver atlanticum TaxID=357466 RepID=A0AAD4XVG1_9MAGN|nr:hypothetical protein MKW98_019017 [Papaver atlanticum]
MEENNKLYEASLKGSVNSLTSLLNANPRLPLDAKFTSNRRTSLHIAAMCGHVNFAEELMKRNDLLSSVKDSHGLTPLHLASARPSLSMVQKLLGDNQEVCMEPDQDGRTPLHLAAMKDRVQIIAALFEKKPNAIHIRNDQNETILHLCVKHNKLKALKLLVELLTKGALPESADSISVNSRDEHGNTILHLAAKRKQMKCVKYLMASVGFEIDTNALNNDNLKARDMLKQTDRDDLEIGCYKKETNTSKDWTKERVNALIVVATLIAGIAFQASMNPPGGVFQEDSMISSKSPVRFTYYLSSLAYSSKSSHFYKYRLSQNKTNIIKYLRDMLITLYDTDSNPYDYLSGESPGIVLGHQKWNKVRSIYKPRFFPYLIRYAGTPILAYRNPILYRVYMTSTAIAFIVSLSIIVLVICGFIYENSIAHQIRILVILMLGSTFCWFISYIVVFVSMSPPFYLNHNELWMALVLSVALMWFSLFAYPIYCGLQIHFLKHRKTLFSPINIFQKEVLIDQFRKEDNLGIGDKKHTTKTYLKFFPVYVFAVIALSCTGYYYYYS